MFEIKCDKTDGIDWLPFVEDTPLYEDITEFSMPKSREVLICIYNALQKSENYFQTETPTAFGNPEYSRFDGFAKGYIAGAGFEYDEVDGYIIISKGCRKYLKIEKPRRTEAYKDALRENRKTLSELGF